MVHLNTAVADVKLKAVKVIAYRKLTSSHSGQTWGGIILSRETKM